MAVTEIKRVSYQVEGMSCAACAISVESILKSQPGVINVTVSFAGRAAIVEMEEKPSLEPKLIEAVNKIGYKLLPADKHVSETEKRSAERLGRLKIKVLFSLLFALPVFFLGMFVMHPAWSAWVQMGLTVPIILWTGNEFFIHAWRQATHLKANMDTLIALGTGTAFMYSTAITIMPSLFSGMVSGGHVFFESAAVVIALVLLGRYLEEKATWRASDAVRKLMALQPDEAIAIREGRETLLPIDLILPGDILLVKPGSRVPADGVITSGATSVDESMLTGESSLVDKKAGDLMMAGTMNHGGSVNLTAEKVGGETRLSRISRMVEVAQGSKPPVQKLVDKITGWFVPVVLGLAIVTSVIWYFFGPDPKAINSVVAAVTLLVVACPCALGLATPTAIMVGVGRGAGAGILFRDAGSLQKAASVDTLLFDKTGTLTIGKPGVEVWEWKEGLPLEVQSITLAVLESSAHPLSNGAAAWLKSRGVMSPADPVHSMVIAGKGLLAHAGDQTLRIGSLKWMQERNSAVPVELSSVIDLINVEGYSVLAITLDDQLVGIAGMQDTLRPGAKEAVSGLASSGKQVWLVTGDHQASAEKVAQLTGISQVRWGMKPEDKLAFVKELQAKGRTVGMVGDGINDTPALAAADLGIAIGTGTDAALETGQVVLAEGKIEKLLMLFSLAHATMATLRRNLFWAFIYNIVAIPIAAGVLYPLSGFLLPPMYAGLAMAFSSVSVVGSSLLLRIKRMD